MDYIAEAIEGQYGERCPEFVEGCAVCEAWAQYVRLTALEQENKRLREALEWYGEKARLARKITSEGDHARYALAGDGGKLATTALTHEEKT